MTWKKILKYTVTRIHSILWFQPTLKLFEELLSEPAQRRVYSLLDQDGTTQMYVTTT